jgi:predicted transposase YbfD/YdcC
MSKLPHINIAGKGGLLESLQEIPDPRTKECDYSLKSLLASVFLSMIDGCVKMNQIPGWLSELHGSQRKRLGFGSTIPDESTFRRVLRCVDTEKLNTILKPWFEETEIRGKIIAIDGKRMCGAHCSSEKPPEILNIVEHGTGQVIGQEVINSPGNERAAAVKWLANTTLFRCLVTGDALHTSREMAELITEKCNSDYLFIIKGNNKMLFEIMQELKMHESRGTPHASTFEQGHGREESREIWCSTNIGWRGQVSRYFPNAKQVATVVRTQKNLKSGKETFEVAYLITSKSRVEMSPEQMLQVNRTHWTVEAKNHYVKDGFLAEDKSRCRAGYLPHNLSILRNVALKILRKVQLALCTKKSRETIPEAHRALQRAGGVCKLLSC